MVNTAMNRRALLAALAAMPFAGKVTAGSDFIDLNWTDLIPKGEPAVPPFVQGLIDHNGPDMSRIQPESSGVRPDLNGKIVRIPGFMLPVNFIGTGVTEFILVPFLGACTHVPPPPANQLVFVTTEPYEIKGVFESVHVTGMFGAASTSTILAEVGYALSAEHIEPFKG